MSLLFKNTSILNPDFSVSRGMDLRIEDARIVHIATSQEACQGDSPCGTQADLRATGTSCAAGGRRHIPSVPLARVIDGAHLLLIPAFYNAHTHTPMTLMRGYGENLRLQEWLGERIFPFEDKMTDEDVYYASQLAFAEGFMHGVVSMSDHYFHSETIVRAAAACGVKLNISRGLSFFDELLDLTGFTPFQESKKLYYDNHDTLDGRIRVEIALHAEYTATPSLIEAVSGLVHETGAPLHVHVSETQKEHEECKERNGGRTPARVFADGGVFDNGGVAAHCVWITEEDADVLKEKGVSVVSCPDSNMKLASGVIDAPMILEKGLNLALGTDGAASNNNFNFFEEIKLFEIGAKSRVGDPTVISPQQALFAATRGGALAQGRADCGLLAEGMRADLIALDLTAPAFEPLYDPAAALVYAASSRDIEMTVADGQIVYRRADGPAANSLPTVDLERASFEVNRSKTRILGELAAEGLGQ